jgi:hypothetical protein
MKAGWYYMAGCLAHLFNPYAARSACGNHDRTSGLRWYRGAGGPLDRCTMCQRIADARKPESITVTARGMGQAAVTPATRWVPELLGILQHMHERWPGRAFTSQALATLMVTATRRDDLRERFQLLVPSCARSGLLDVVHVGTGRHTARYRLPPRGPIVDDLSQVHEAVTPEERAAVAAAWAGKGEK